MVIGCTISAKVYLFVIMSLFYLFLFVCLFVYLVLICLSLFILFIFVSLLLILVFVPDVILKYSCVVMLLQRACICLKSWVLFITNSTLCVFFSGSWKMPHLPSKYFRNYDFCFSRYCAEMFWILQAYSFSFIRFFHH